MHLHKKIIGLLAVGVAILLLPLASANAATTVGTNVSVAGTLAVTSILTVTGATTLTGAATLSSTLTVAGLSTFTGGFISSASSSIGSSLNVTGNLNASSSFFAASLSTLTGGFISSASSTVTSINVSGNLNASSTLFLGGNLLPNTNSARNIGAYGTAIQKVYVSSSAYLADVFAASSTFYNSTDTSTVYLNSGAALAGGRIIMKSAQSAVCYQLYFAENAGGAGIVTSTITCPNN